MNSLLVFSSGDIQFYYVIGLYILLSVFFGSNLYCFQNFVFKSFHHGKVRFWISAPSLSLQIGENRHDIVTNPLYTDKFFFN